MSLVSFVRPVARSVVGQRPTNHVGCLAAAVAAANSTLASCGYLPRQAPTPAIGTNLFMKRTLFSTNRSLDTLPTERTTAGHSKNNNNSNNNNTSNNTHFSTQAEMMHQLGISTNGQVRPSTRHSNGMVNQRRKRPKFPARRSEPRPGALYPLKAMHIAQTIDLDRVRQTVLSQNTEHRKLFGKNSLVVELEAPDDGAPAAGAAETDPQAPPRFVSVFRFGSVVFLNVPDKEATVLLDRIRLLATDTMDSERREHFGIMVQPQELYATTPGTDPPPDQIVTGDYCIVPEIDLNGVAVISNIMAQTVALDSYNDMVDRLLSQFATINSAVRASGHFKHSDKNFLFKTVAQNNAIFIDMISKIRLKDRSDTAWTMTKYETIHYGLKAEFEIDDRFDQIEFKLNLIQQNSKFFLEVLQHQKSNSLEWIIVWLIALESILMCVDMSGKGEALFQYLGLI